MDLFGTNDAAVRAAADGITPAAAPKFSNLISTKFGEFKSAALPASFEEGVSDVKSFFDLTGWQYVISIGVAVSGVTALVATYNAVSKVNTQYQSCLANGLGKTINTKFIVVLVISIIILLLGVLLAWMFRKSDHLRLITLGVSTAGALGIIYAILIKLNTSKHETAKVIGAWVVFIIFLILAFFFSGKRAVAT